MKKKAKTKKGDTGKDENRTTNVVGKQKKSQQQAQVAVAEIESVFDEVFSVFLGCMWLASASRYLTDIYSQRQYPISFRLSVSYTLLESHT